MHQTRANLDKKRAEVSAMFDGVAARYDLLNSLLSLGRDRGWRRETVTAVAARPGERILNLAAGTGTSSLTFVEAGAHVFPTDLSMGMLRVGKQQQPRLSFVRGDALALPYADSVFDAVTISYGIYSFLEKLLQGCAGGAFVLNIGPLWGFDHSNVDAID